MEFIVGIAVNLTLEIKMKETTQAEIIALAEKHKSNPAISALLASFSESKTTATNTANYLNTRIDVAINSINFKHNFRIPLNNEDFVTEAHKLACEMTIMNKTILNLACILQSLGEDIVY